MFLRESFYSNLDATPSVEWRTFFKFDVCHMWFNEGSAYEKHKCSDDPFVAQQKHLCDFGRIHYEKHFCEIFLMSFP